MSAELLGKLVTSSHQRDAVHIAMIPVIAYKLLNPGEHVGIVDLKQRTVTTHVRELLGVVDPFLKEPVQQGQCFWLLLYPGTITGLSHQWEHSAFPVRPSVQGSLAESVQWMVDFAAERDMGYQDLMNAAQEHIDTEGSTTYTLGEEDVEVPDEFWRHFAAITGEVLPTNCDGQFFSCAC